MQGPLGPVTVEGVRLRLPPDAPAEFTSLRLLRLPHGNLIRPSPASAIRPWLADGGPECNGVYIHMHVGSRNSISGNVDCVSYAVFQYLNAVGVQLVGGLMVCARQMISLNLRKDRPVLG